MIPSPPSSARRPKLSRGDSDWWDATFDFVGGCEPVSPGCANCYAAKLAGTRQRDRLHTGVTDRVGDRYFFNGKLTELSPGHRSWTWPLTWPGAERPLLCPGQPSLIWIGAMSDVFLEGHRTAVLDRAIATVVLSNHIGQLLTKRPDRMAAYFATRVRPRWQQKLWLGFSAEDQRWFDERWPHMRPLADAGWTVFCSVAPMLGPVILPPDFLALRDQAWVICSGEQGPHRVCRDMDPRWARALRDQCAAAGVPFFMKQMARKAPIPPDLLIFREFPRCAVKTEKLF
jgi:protein gp37